jgi:hypothetical protein
MSRDSHRSHHRTPEFHASENPTDPCRGAAVSVIHVQLFEVNITIDAIKYSLSIKVNNRVFAYLSTRRKHFLIATFDAADDWREYPIKTDDELTIVKPLIKAAMERRIK